MIIRKIGFLVCMLVVCSLNINTAMAQSRSYEGGITVNPGCGWNRKVILFMSI